MDIQEELNKAKEEMEKAKQETTQSLVVKDNPKQEIAPTQPKDGEDTAIMLQEKKKQVLKSEEIQKAGNLLANEDIKSDFANEAARIQEKNVNAAELNLKNKKRKRQIDREEAESQLEHKYKMDEIQRNGEHKKMLDKRKKLVEKYGYLYDNEKLTTAIDGDGKEYKVPKDFSYSNFVNKFRQFGRNMSKLDKPLLQTIKWVLIVGVVVLGIFILKWTGIIN